jgi:hypothetical protein
LDTICPAPHADGLTIDVTSTRCPEGIGRGRCLVAIAISSSGDHDRRVFAILDFGHARSWS